MKTKFINHRSIGTASLLALMLMQLTNSAHAQSAWTIETPVPNNGNSMSAAAINGIVYVAGGINGSPMSNVQAYNTTNNSWTQVASLPAVRYQNSGMAVISNKLYYPGGWTTSPALPNNNLWVYDPVANSWSTLASMPILSGAGGCGVISNLLYVTSPDDGYNGYYPYLHVYDPGANTWTQLANSPHIHLGPAYGVIGTKFYVAGGFDGVNVTNVVDVYDPGSNTWTTEAPMLYSRAGPGSAVFNGKLYVFSGYSPSGTYLNTTEVYDPVANRWMMESNMPTACESSAAAAANGSIYVVGGDNSTNSYLGTVQAITPTETSINVYAGLWVSGLLTHTYEIDYRNNLNSGSWTPLTTSLVLSNNPTFYLDTNSPNYTQRFYRSLFLH